MTPPSSFYENPVKWHDCGKVVQPNGVHSLLINDGNLGDYYLNHRRFLRDKVPIATSLVH